MFHLGSGSTIALAGPEDHLPPLEIHIFPTQTIDFSQPARQAEQGQKEGAKVAGRQENLPISSWEGMRLGATR
jgi:hypothetical protein